MKTFQEIYDLDITERVNNKKDNQYLGWADAVALMKQVDPNFVYEIKKFDNGQGRLVPYMYDEKIGYMVETSVTVNGITLEMCLPVMENHGSRNFAMKAEPYEVVNEKYKITVGSCDMFAVNKTIMRCLVKNMAMFGLGLKLYEFDVEGGNTNNTNTKNNNTKSGKNNYTPDASKKISEKQEDFIVEMFKKLNVDVDTQVKTLTEKYKVTKFKDLNQVQANELITYLKGKLEEQK